MSHLALSRRYNEDLADSINRKWTALGIYPNYKAWAEIERPGSRNWVVRSNLVIKF